MTLPTIAGVQSRISSLTNLPPIMLAADIAEVFETTAKNLMRRVRANLSLFPAGALIELTNEQYEEKWCRGGTTSQGKRTDLTHFGFTELAAMIVPLLLRTPRSREIGVVVISAFIQQRETLIADMRRELAVDRDAYIGARKIRQRIMSVPASRLAAEPEHAVVLALLPASKFYQTREWKALRVDALRLAGFQCEWCGASAKQRQLEVDHITARIADPERAFDISNLRVLCRPCHEGRHAGEWAL